VVWEKERKIAKCDVSKCTHKEFSCASRGSTRPLWHHLEKAHWKLYVTTEDYHKKRKTDQDEHGTIKVLFKNTDIDNIKLRNMFTTWVVNRQRPISIVEDSELIEIIQYLNPTAELVKAGAIKNSIISHYNLGKQELKISFTSDLWTSPNYKSFISATAHYIDENWTLQETLVDFSLLSGQHNGMNIANAFFKMLEDYKITSKLLGITLDNAANNGVFVRELEVKLKEEENLVWNSERNRFRCFNHILNLAAQAALDEIKEDVCRALNTLTSTYNDFHDYSISHNQWNTLEKVAEFLKPFKDLTTKMSSSTYCTAFWIIPLFNIIFNHVEDVASNMEIKS
ncbi:24870_t:CDS:2, partial [Gigaspora rosea]